MNAERSRFGNLLGCELADRIKRNKGAGADVKRDCCEIDLAFDPFSSLELLARPPVEPGACGQVDAARLCAFFDDGCDEDVAAPKIFAAELHRFSIPGIVKPQCPHRWQACITGLANQTVVVGQEM